MAETGGTAGYTVLLVGRSDCLVDCSRLLTWLGCTWEIVETCRGRSSELGLWCPIWCC
ncbi:MAG: hypothetical protein SNJ60_02600 [Pseudanabaenaceae cyanobacterium]